tara:strand:+ start:694 stop:1152 length:459 start_codon:yes stop_codon:yes gene_type:complete
MEYVNDVFGFAKHFFPDSYNVSSIADFVYNASAIGVPSPWKLLNPVSWIDPHIFLREVFVDFQDVAVRRSLDGYVLSDETGQLCLDHGTNESPSQWSDSYRAYMDSLLRSFDDGRIYNVTSTYEPESGKHSLFLVKSVDVWGMLFDASLEDG